jgi:hypothetical protein
MRRIPLGAACLAVVTALVVVDAPAATVKTKNHLIVPGLSIGGVAINMSVAKAKATWGPNRNCDHNTRHGLCTYQVHNGRQFGDAKFFWDSNRVYRISIGTFGGVRLTGPVATFKTANGVRLGSTYAAVRQAYPTAAEVSPLSVLRLKGPRKHFTEFVFAGDDPFAQVTPTTDKLVDVKIENPDYRNSR